MNIIFHADDYGIDLDQSRLILSCSSACGGQGPLNSTSVLVGSPAYAECAWLIRPFVQAGLIKLGLHLNLVEGPCSADPALVPNLVDDRGMFCLSFAQLLAQSSRSTELRSQIRTEIDAQLDTFLAEFPELCDALRVDGHQHTHLIPAVLDALLSSIEDHSCALEYLRYPAEPVVPYLAKLKGLKEYPPINGVKNGLLNTLGTYDRIIIERHLGIPAQQFLSMHSALFFGLMLSGKMDRFAALSLVDDAIFAASAKGRDLEILFHPGGEPDRTHCLDPQLDGFVEFYLSEHRELERRALQNLRNPFVALP